jgi:hypothetical protein
MSFDGVGDRGVERLNLLGTLRGCCWRRSRYEGCAPPTRAASSWAKSRRLPLVGQRSNPEERRNLVGGDRIVVGEVAQALDGSLGLVHAFAGPGQPPRGRE